MKPPPPREPQRCPGKLLKLLILQTNNIINNNIIPNRLEIRAKPKASLGLRLRKMLEQSRDNVRSLEIDHSPILSEGKNGKLSQEVLRVHMSSGTTITTCTRHRKPRPERSRPGINKSMLPNLERSQYWTGGGGTPVAVGLDTAYARVARTWPCRCPAK